MSLPLSIHINGMSCAGCATKLETKLNLLNGVKADVNYALSSARVILSDINAIKDVKNTLVASNYQYDQETFTFNVSGWSCSNCALTTVKKLLANPLILTAEANFATGKVVVSSFQQTITPADITNVIKKQGYIAQSSAVDETADDSKVAEKENIKSKAQRYKIIMLAMSVLFSLPFIFVMLAMFLSSSPIYFPVWLQFLLATPVQFIVGAHFYKGAFYSLRSGSANMDVLVVTGTSAAYFYSLFLFITLGEQALGNIYFEASVVVITLINLGKYLEDNAKKNTTAAIKALMELRPDQANVLKDDVWQVLPVSEVVLGDRVRILAGEKVPVDGIILQGETDIDEAMITGESFPVCKGIEDKVIGGSINNTGTIEIEVNAVGENTSLSKIISLVENAQMSKAPFQQLVDRISGIFVPIVFTIALLTFSYWFFVVGDFETALVTAVAVLVIACPCALGLATPAAVVTGTGLAAQKGILIKDIDTLQKIHKVTNVMLDKTGTLTKGQPKVIQFEADANEDSRNHLIELAASLQQQSAHPLAKAITDYAQQQDLSLSEADAVQTLAGYGIKGYVNGIAVMLGSIELMQKENVEMGKISSTRSCQPALTHVYFSVNNQCKAMIGIADELREQSMNTIAQLQAADITATMLSGDNYAAVEHVAQQLNITHYHAQVKPEDKSDYVIACQQQGGFVAMVGDGINDAPALAQADVSIAMGSGTDVAMETANVTLLRHDPSLIIAAISISKLTWRKIQQNLFWAFIFNIIGIPLAAMGYLSPEIAGAAMAFSSITVLSNSLLIKRWQPEVNPLMER